MYLSVKGCLIFNEGMSHCSSTVGIKKCFQSCKSCMKLRKFLYKGVKRGYQEDSDCRYDLRAGPGQWEAPHPLPVLGICASLPSS